PGDKTQIQKFTASTGSDAYKGASNFINSDGIYGQASFIRFKTLSISYFLPERWMKSLKISSCQISVRAQNLALFTNYKGSDPENQNLFTVPPLRTIVTSLRITI